MVKIQSFRHEPKQNHLLAALPAEIYDHMSLHLELVAMPLGEILCESGGQLQHVYFPTTAIASLHYIMENGSSAEIAGVGREGVLGVSLLMGGACHTQPDGRVYRRSWLPAEGTSDDGRI